MTDFSTLATRISAPVLIASDAGFAEEVSGFNLAIVQQPDAVVAAANTADIVETVRFAHGHSLPVSVQATGHGAHHPITAGILISTKRLTGVTIDTNAGTATFQAGTRWDQIVAAAAEHGLAPIAGASSSVGAIGYLLGGGLGPLARSHGFSSDYLRSLTVVTGTGEVVQASAEENTELFWALRGGKGGLGVVLEAQLSLVELATLYAGSLLFDIEHLDAVLGGWIDWAASAANAVTTSLAIVRFPDFEQVPAPLRGRHLISLRFAYPGDSAEGERLAAPLRSLAPVYLDAIGEIPAGAIATIHNDPTAPGLGWGKSMVLGPLDGDFASTFAGLLGAGNELPLVAVELRHLGGATTTDVPGGSAVGGRDSAFTLMLIGVPDPALFEAVLPAAAAGLTTAITPWISATTTINWVNDSRNEAEFASAWPAETLERLAAVRAQYDPSGIFPYGPA